MRQFSDPEFLREAYGTVDGLSIRIHAQERFNRSPRIIFDELTRDAMTICRPTAILDIGAGTGTWYRSIRKNLGTEPFYQAVDQSPTMVDTLKNVLSSDPQSDAMVGEAGHLSYPGESFDWVGFHFMLYHVRDIKGTLSEAWTYLKPGGVLLAATNGHDSYREMRDMHATAARMLNLPYHEEPQGDRFSLKNGAAFFAHGTPHVVEFPSGLRFPTMASFLAYYGSGFCWAGIAQDHHLPDIRDALVDQVGQLAEPIFARDGKFDLSHTVGYFWVHKP